MARTPKQDWIANSKEEWVTTVTSDEFAGSPHLYERLQTACLQMLARSAEASIHYLSRIACVLERIEKRTQKDIRRPRRKQ